MCIGVCLPPNQDTTSAIVGAGDTLDFSFHFFTDPFMIGPDTGRARIRFSNANGSQQSITQNYRGITYTQSTSVLNQPIEEKRLQQIVNIMGQPTNKESRKIQIYIYKDGSIEKKITTD